MFETETRNGIIRATKAWDRFTLLDGIGISFYRNPEGETAGFTLSTERASGIDFERQR